MGKKLTAKLSSIENGEPADPSAPPTEMDELAPTAPALPSEEGAASAPPIETFQSAECVVCMERKVFYEDIFKLYPALYCPVRYHLPPLWPPL